METNKLTLPKIPKKKSVSKEKELFRNLYKIVPDPKDPVKWCVLLLEGTGDWAGIIYSYGQFSIIEPKKEGDNPTFKFETDLVYVPDRLRGVTFADERELEIQTLFGKILFDIIELYGNNTKTEDGKLYIDIKL